MKKKSLRFLFHLRQKCVLGRYFAPLGFYYSPRFARGSKANPREQSPALGNTSPWYGKKIIGFFSFLMMERDNETFVWFSNSVHLWNFFFFILAKVLWKVVSNCHIFQNYSVTFASALKLFNKVECILHFRRFVDRIFFFALRLSVSLLGRFLHHNVTRSSNPSAVPSLLLFNVSSTTSFWSSFDNGNVLSTHRFWKSLERSHFGAKRPFN